MTSTQKKPIKKALSRLMIGQSETWPIERYGAVIAGVSKYKMEMARIGWDYNVSRDMENFTVTIERTA